MLDNELKQRRHYEAQEIRRKMDKRLPINYKGNDEKLRRISERWDKAIAENQELKKGVSESHPHHLLKGNGTVFSASVGPPRPDLDPYKLKELEKKKKKEKD